MKTPLKVLIITLILLMSVFIVRSVFDGSQGAVDGTDPVNQGNLDQQIDVSGDDPNIDSSGKIELVTKNGRSMSVSNLKINPVSSYVGASSYFISNDEAGYQILFNDSNDSFAIDIFKQPVSATKEIAVADLASILGITTSDMCLINIYISTTYDFDPQTSGRNLGIKGCN